MKATDNKSVCSQYMRAVRKGLQIHRLLKGSVIKDLKERVTDFCSEKKSVTLEELYTEFGTPEEISKSFFDRQEYEGQLRKIKKRSCLLAIVAVVITAMLVWVTVYAVETVISQNGHYVINESTYGIINTIH